MKKILIFISLFLIGICTINAQSVTANQMNGRLQMTTVSNVSDSTWSITGYFTNSVNKYLPSNINVNDKFFCQIGANTYVGRISVINSRSDVTKLITFRVICNYPNPPNNIGAIIRATSNGYPVFVDGLPNALQAGIQNYFATLINTNAAGNPCEKTITKTNHGFSKGTPVKRVGGTYVRPTNDTIIPDFIVVDSLTANTFKVSTCGIYTSTLADGLYWYTSAAPGYSLTQDTVKVPLFQVLNDTMILNPIVGFNLMSGSGGTADGNGIYSGSDSLSQTDTYAAMAADGSQNFALGYFPAFPDVDYIREKGLYISPNYWDEVSLINSTPTRNSYLGVISSGIAFALSESNLDGRRGQSQWRPGSFYILTQGSINTDKRWLITVDSSKFEITRNIAGVDRTYNLLPASQYPSTTPNTVNILKWTAGVPSFGFVPNIYTEDGNVPDNVTRTLYLDSDQQNYMRFNNSATGKEVNFNFAHDPNNDYSPFADMYVGYDKGPTYHGNSFFRLGGGVFTGGPSLRFSDQLYANSFGERTIANIRSSSYGDGLKHLVVGGIVDSVGSKNSFGGISISWDSLGSSSALKKAHFTGFSRGKEDLQIYKNKGNKSWLVQTLYDDNPNMKNFDWIRVKNLDGDSTGHNVELYGKYPFANSTPSSTAGAISTHIWTAGTPSFLRSQHGVATGTTDGSGDLTVTFAAAMPDATYSLIATVEGTTSYTISVHTKATGTCKVRFFNPATGAVVTATSVTISYEAKDY